MTSNQTLLLDENSEFVLKESNLDTPELFVKGAYLVPALGYNTFDGHVYISGATGAGKSYFIRKMVDKDKLGRKCVLFTDLEKEDPAYQGMNYVKYSEKGPYNTEWLRKNQDNKIMIFDDVQYNDEINSYRDKLLEKGRHHNILVICVNHKLQDYWSSKVPLNECRYVVCFPCSNRGSAAKFLRSELELNKQKTENILTKVCEEGRHMIVHRFSPNFIAGTKSIFKV